MDNNKPNNKPARPADWKLTIDDLMTEMKEGKRTGIDQPDLDWAREYEISLIPESYSFPRQGDVYESICDHEIAFMTAWAAPFTGSGQGILLKGERIWISDETDEKCTGTYADPVDYPELEQRMVTETDRSADKYGGFYFFVRTVDLNEKYKLVDTGFQKERYK
ncbi:MAG: hypothetical protein ABJA78_18900 [Ferruginibacter sp.]